MSQPYMIGHSGFEQEHMKHTYYVISKGEHVGKLVPDPLMFFSDSFGRASSRVFSAVNKDYGIIRSMLDRYLDEKTDYLIPGCTPELLEEYKKSAKDVKSVTRLLQSVKKNSIKQAVESTKQGLDEILTICDIDNSFRTVETSHEGFYLQESLGFFNTENLRKLYHLLDHIKYGSETEQPNQAYHDFMNYWGELKRQFFEWHHQLGVELNVGEMQDPIPPSIADIIRMSD